MSFPCLCQLAGICIPIYLPFLLLSIEVWHNHKGSNMKGKEKKKSPLCGNLNDLLDNLHDDIIEEGVGKVPPDLCLDVPVWREIGDVGSVSGASTSIEHPEDMAIPVKDNRA
jgi:hypothetical protein